MEMSAMLKIRARLKIKPNKQIENQVTFALCMLCFMGVREVYAAKAIARETLGFQTKVLCLEASVGPKVKDPPRELRMDHHHHEVVSIYQSVDFLQCIERMVIAFFVFLHRVLN